MLLEIAATFAAEKGYEKLLQLQYDLLQMNMRLPEYTAMLSTLIHRFF